MFLYLFDMLDFDDNGRVCATKEVDLAHARSNYLYLLSKYNQMFLKERAKDEKSVDKSENNFFRDELKDVLFDVENNGNFEKAAKCVLLNCCPKVQLIAKISKSQREIIEKLTDKLVLQDKEMAVHCQKAQNARELEYRLAFLLAANSKTIERLKKEDLSIVSNKSKLFKNIIGCNSMTETSVKLHNGEISLEQLKKAS